LAYFAAYILLVEFEEINEKRNVTPEKESRTCYRHMRQPTEKGLVWF